MVRRALRLLAFACVLGALTPAPAWLQEAEEGGPDPSYVALRDAYAGRWRLANGAAAASATIDRAVERAVEAMNYFIRPMARPRLREATLVDRWYRFDFADDGRITLHFEDRDRYTVPLGRTRRYRSDDGDPMRVTIRRRDGNVLEAVFATDEGTRWYSFRESSGAVTLTVTTTGNMMPDPMRYQLRYQR